MSCVLALQNAILNFNFTREFMMELSSHDRGCFPCLSLGRSEYFFALNFAKIIFQRTSFDLMASNAQTIGRQTKTISNAKDVGIPIRFSSKRRHSAKAFMATPFSVRIFPYFPELFSFASSKFSSISLKAEKKLSCAKIKYFELILINLIMNST